MKSIKNSIEIKTINTNIIRSILQEKTKATKQELSIMSGLSTVTIGAILNNLIEDGEVFELDLLPSLGGRPAHQFAINKDFTHFLVVRLRVKKGLNVITMQVINLLNEVIEQSESVLEEVNLSNIDQHIQPFITKYSTIKVLGFGLPGVTGSHGIISNDYSQLVGEDFASYFKDKYQLDVVIGNDVNLAVLGYAKTKEVNNGVVVYIYLPQQFDPGVGLYWHGKIHTGLNHSAGEIGHIPINIDWKTLDYDSPEVVSEALFKLIVTYQSILDPNQFVFAGDFLNTTHLDLISELLNHQCAFLNKPEIKISLDFDHDYEIGIREYTLNANKRNVQL